MKSKFWSYFKVLIFFSVGIVLIWLSFSGLRDNEIEKLRLSFINANYWWLLLSVLLGILSHIIRAFRWTMLARPMGYQPKLSNSFYAVMIGYLVNYGVPRLGEISRCTVLNKYEKIPFTKSFGTVVAERVLDIILFLLIFMAMLISQFDKISIYLEVNIYPGIKQKINYLADSTNLILMLISFFVAIVSIFVFFRKKIKGAFLNKIKNFIGGFYEGLMSIKNVKNKLAFTFHTALIWFCYYLSMHVCFYCLPECSDFGLGIGITSFVFGSLTVMITPGGIGAYPFALQKVLLLIYGVQEVVGASFGWLSWTTSFIAIVSMGLISLILVSVRNKNYKPTLPEAEKN